MLRGCEAWPCPDGLLHRCGRLLKGPSVSVVVRVEEFGSSSQHGSDLDGAMGKEVGSLSECGMGQIHETHPTHGFLY